MGTDYRGPCGHYKDFASYSEEFRSPGGGLSRRTTCLDNQGISSGRVSLAVSFKQQHGGALSSTAGLGEVKCMSVSESGTGINMPPLVGMGGRGPSDINDIFCLCDTHLSS